MTCLCGVPHRYSSRLHLLVKLSRSLQGQGKGTKHKGGSSQYAGDFLTNTSTRPEHKLRQSQLSIKFYQNHHYGWKETLNPLNPQAVPGHFFFSNFSHCGLFFLVFFFLFVLLGFFLLQSKSCSSMETVHRTPRGNCSVK